MTATIFTKKSAKTRPKGDFKSPFPLHISYSKRSRSQLPSWTIQISNVIYSLYLLTRLLCATLGASSIHTTYIWTSMTSGPDTSLNREPYRSLTPSSISCKIISDEENINFYHSRKTKSIHDMNSLIVETKTE